MAVTTSSTEAINNQTKTGQGGGGATGGGGRAGSSEAHNPKKDRMKWAVRLLSWVPILACLSLCAVLAFRLVSLEAKVEVIQVMTIYGKHCSDGFELEFSGSSEPELKIFRAESSRAGAF